MPPDHERSHNTTPFTAPATSLNSSLSDDAFDVHAFAVGWTRARGENAGASHYGKVAVAQFPRYGIISRRKMELLAWKPDPQEMVCVARQNNFSDYWLCVFAPDETWLAGFAELGFVHIRTDWPMRRDNLDTLPPCTMPVDANGSEQLVLVQTYAEVPTSDPEEVLGRLEPGFFDEPSFCVAIILLDGRPVAAGRSVKGDANTVIIDSVGTSENYRRRGLGTKVMHALLEQAVEQGATSAILIATDLGRLLYASMGFRLQGACFCLKPEEEPEI